MELPALGGGELGSGSKVNICELMINPVIMKMRKMLVTTRISQKASRQDIGFCISYTKMLPCREIVST